MTGYAFLKSRRWYIGVAPSEPKRVYSDRDSPSGWERVEITRLENGRYVVRFVDANVMLSLQPDGQFETRPAGTYGDFEQILGGVLDDGPATGVQILGPFEVEPAPAP